MTESQPSGGQTTGCDKCGAGNTIYPPTPEYSVMLLEACPKGDSIERPFECNSCNEINKRYWDTKHLFFATQQRDKEKRPRHISTDELDTAP